ncbi:MAG: hypothetical protein IKC12_05855 [Alistipes sp.]|nr:hypothetical protein [Alistipes sp.]
MNYYSEHPRQTTAANVRELMAQKLALQGVLMATCDKQGRFLSGAYIVAVQMGKDSVY